MSNQRMRLSWDKHLRFNLHLQQNTPPETLDLPILLSLKVMCSLMVAPLQLPSLQALTVPLLSRQDKWIQLKLISMGLLDHLVVNSPQDRPTAVVVDIK